MGHVQPAQRGVRHAAIEEGWHECLDRGSLEQVEWKQVEGAEIDGIPVEKAVTDLEQPKAKADLSKPN